MYVRTKDGANMRETPEVNVRTALDYIVHTYGDDVTFWEKNPHLELMSIREREAWNREAWDREQDELANIIRQRPQQTDEQVLHCNYE